MKAGQLVGYSEANPEKMVASKNATTQKVEEKMLGLSKRKANVEIAEEVEIKRVRLGFEELKI